MPVTWDFKNRAMIVTGAGGGIGLHVARALYESGAMVTGLDIKPRPAVFPTDAGYASIDLADAGDVAKAVDEARGRMGHVDGLVNAAGLLWFGHDRSAVDIDLDTWDVVMAANLKSVVHTARAAVPAMREAGGGAMVHFSSIQCLRGDERPQDAYQAAKAGVVALSKSLAVQFARDNIRSNTLLPGPTRSPMQARWDADPEAADALARHIPLGRVGETDDLAAACLFLLSDASRWVTGTELIVDGGITALP